MPELHPDSTVPTSSPPPVPPVAAGDQSRGQSFDATPMWELIKRLPRYARVSASLARDPRVPGRSKAMLAAGGIYLISPIDLVPGFIPIAGQLDDLYVMLTGLQQAIRACPADVIEEHFAVIGLVPAAVDDDLAIIRAFVRDGVGWSIRQGGKLMATIATRLGDLAQRARQGESHDDQKPL
jgi:uncharacterized membrane protein YkvA (DUF1232 family)